jgi:hypothetical protein
MSLYHQKVREIAISVIDNDSQQLIDNLILEAVSLYPSEIGGNNLNNYIQLEYNILEFIVMFAKNNVNIQRRLINTPTIKVILDKVYVMFTRHIGPHENYMQRNVEKIKTLISQIA